LFNRCFSTFWRFRVSSPKYSHLPCSWLWFIPCRGPVQRVSQSRMDGGSVDSDSSTIVPKTQDVPAARMALLRVGLETTERLTSPQCRYVDNHSAFYCPTIPTAPPLLSAVGGMPTNCFSVRYPFNRRVHSCKLDAFSCHVASLLDNSNRCRERQHNLLVELFVESHHSLSPRKLFIFLLCPIAERN
jgi:hypothetical protein